MRNKEMCKRYGTRSLEEGRSDLNWVLKSVSLSVSNMLCHWLQSPPVSSHDVRLTSDLASIVTCSYERSDSSLHLHLLHRTLGINRRAVQCPARADFFQQPDPIVTRKETERQLNMIHNTKLSSVDKNANNDGGDATMPNVGLSFHLCRDKDVSTNHSRSTITSKLWPRIITELYCLVVPQTAPFQA